METSQVEANAWDVMPENTLTCVYLSGEISTGPKAVRPSSQIIATAPSSSGL